MTLSKFPYCINCGKKKNRLSMQVGKYSIKECMYCRLGVRDPMKIPKNFHYNFLDQMKNYSLWCYIHNNIFKEIEKYKKPEHAIDLGCSEGISLVVGKSRGWDMEGIENSTSARDFGNKYLNVKIHLGNIEKIELSNFKLDVVILHHVLEHLSRPDLLLSKLYSNMQKDGLLYMCVPNMNSIVEKILGPRWFDLQIEQHIWFFRPHHLSSMISRAGFKIIREFTFSRMRPIVGVQKLSKQILSKMAAPFGMGDEIHLIAEKR